MTNVLENYNIVSNHFVVKEIISFKNEDRTYLAFALNGKEFNIKKLSENECRLNDLYGMMLLSRYAKNGYKYYNKKDFPIEPKGILDLKNRMDHSSNETTRKCYSDKNNNLVALKSGYYFMIFKKDDIPFFNDLKKTNQMIKKDNEEFNLYEAPTWELAQKVDDLMGNEWDGYDIDEYTIDKNNVRV